MLTVASLLGIPLHTIFITFVEKKGEISRYPFVFIDNKNKSSLSKCNYPPFFRNRHKKKKKSGVVRLIFILSKG